MPGNRQKLTEVEVETPGGMKTTLRVRPDQAERYRKMGQAQSKSRSPAGGSPEAKTKAAPPPT